MRASPRSSSWSAVQASSSCTRSGRASPRLVRGARSRQLLLFWDDAGAHTRGRGSSTEATACGSHVREPMESEEAYAPDNDPCSVRELADGAAITAPPDRSQIQKTIAVHAGASDWSSSTGSGFQVGDDEIVIRAHGVEARRMGVHAARHAHEARSCPRRAHQGCRAGRGRELSARDQPRRISRTARFMVELEAMSPIVKLAPGASLRHLERWTLLPARVSFALFWWSMLQFRWQSASPHRPVCSDASRAQALRSRHMHFFRV
jgi:hypothetical protein